MARHDGLAWAAAFAVTMAAVGSVDGGLLVDASMRNGDYGGGSAIDTFSGPYGHGASPHVLGIVDGPMGTAFTSTETNGLSNALINWVIGSNNSSLRQHGTFSMHIYLDRATHKSGWIFGDNYGFNQFHNGQGSFGAYAGRMDQGTPDIADDQFRIHWNTWHNSVWYPHVGVFLDYNRWYDVGFAWGGPANDFEIWVDREMELAQDLPQGVIKEWGSAYIGNGSGWNLGLGDNHERGYDGYGSVAGMMFADVKIWNEYRDLGDTSKPVIPEPAVGAMVIGFAALGLSARRNRSTASR